MRIRAAALALVALLTVPAACTRKSAPAGAKTPAAAKTPVVPPPLRYEVRLGKVTFTHYCQTCHGESGAGDGFNAFNLDPHPRDLSDPQFQKKKSDAELADAIQRGGAGVGLSALMPPWGHTLSARQIDELVLYLRTLPALRKPST
ncbi:MAG: cytochrome c [Acidobacteriota bacterium]|nr:cytochrome c [Acidobacteriota bacterium]